MLRLPQGTGKSLLWGKIFLVLWVIAVSLLLSLLGAQHAAPFARSSALGGTTSFVHSLTQESGAWQMLHVVADGCRCSARVIDHLLQRGRYAGLGAEAVVVIGHRPDWERKLRALGFSYAELSGDAVAEKTGVEAAPTLVIIDPQGTVRYAAGYYKTWQLIEAQDAAILQQVKQGQDPVPLPLFGCAFSQRLQAAVDPLRLKYPLTVVPIEVSP